MSRKNVYFAFLFFFTFLLFSSFSLTEQSLAENAPLEKYRVAVGDLIISPQISAKQAEIIKNSTLMADIENAFRNTRKFDVLTRRAAQMTALAKEQEFAQSDQAAGDAAQTGMMKNAQAIINVEVLNFSFGRSATPVPNLEGKWHVNDYCSLELSVQIIDTATGSINAAFPVSASSGSGTFMSNSRYGASSALMAKTLEKASTALTNEFVNTVFPTVVINVTGKQIWINRGNDTALKVGDVFEIFQPGEALIDPITGENLGTSESMVGKAKVVRINPKASLCDIIEGDPASMAPSYILRKPVK